MSKVGYCDLVMTNILSSRDMEGTMGRCYGELDSDRWCGSGDLYVNE